jgi:hypothetical protein
MNRFIPGEYGNDYTFSTKERREICIDRVGTYLANAPDSDTKDVLEALLWLIRTQEGATR